MTGRDFNALASNVFFDADRQGAIFNVPDSVILAGDDFEETESAGRYERRIEEKLTETELNLAQLEAAGRIASRANVISRF